MKAISTSFQVKPLFAPFFEKAGDLKKYYENVAIKKGSSLKIRRDGFYYVASGILRYETTKPASRILRLCTNGDLIGFGSWIAPSFSANQMTAVSDSSLQFWSRESFDALKKKYPEVNDLIIDQLVLTLLHKDERIALLETASSEKKFMLLLEWLAKKFGKKMELGILIDAELDRQCLAMLAGCSVVTVVRNITALEDQGLLRRRRRKLVVTDLARLGKAAQDF